MGGKAISYETDDLRDDVVTSILAAQKEYLKIVAVLLECTTLLPFAKDISDRTGLPMFDFIACIEWI